MKSSASPMSQWMITDRHLVGDNLDTLCACIHRETPKKDYVVLRESDLAPKRLDQLILKIQRPIILNWNGGIDLMPLKLLGLHMSHAVATSLVKKEGVYEGYFNYLSKNPATLIGTSIHSMEEWVQVSSMEWDYVFLSNLFETSCKSGKLGLGILESSKIVASIKRDNRRIKVVALGGVYPEHSNLLRACGFDGIAMRTYYHTGIF